MIFLIQTFIRLNLLINNRYNYHHRHQHMHEIKLAVNMNNHSERVFEIGVCNTFNEQLSYNVVTSECEMLL